MRHPLIDARFSGDINNSWPSKCTIQSVIITLSPAKQPIASSYTTVPGLADLPCRIAPPVEHIAEYQERRTEDMTTEFNQMQVLLWCHIPEIQARVHVAVVDGVRYQIRGTDFDSQRQTTRLRVEIVK